jgi:hypothetical protein
MNKILLFFHCCLLLPVLCFADGKQIYIPEDLRDNDFDDPSSRWCYAHCRMTENFVIFWESGFGDDPSSPPELEGHKMSVDLDNLCERLETFYDYYYNTLQFAHKGSLCDKYRMMVMINYSLEGTAYGGDYDGVIGALWVAPNRIQDKTLNCIAHELGHCFQSQIMCDGEGEAWGGSGFLEMTSQWMLWQVNPNWIGSERYHWDAFCKNTHKAYLSFENIYRSPYIIEYWGMKRGLTAIGDLYRAGKRGEDPVITYKKLYNLSQSAFCDEMYDAVCHIVNLDYPRCWDLTRPFACQMTTALDTLGNGWYAPKQTNVPENYGFNVIPLVLPKAGKKVAVTFCTAVPVEQGGFRCGFVVVNKDGRSVYSPMKTISVKSKKVKLSYKPSDEAAKVFLVVMAAPAEHPAPHHRMRSLEMPDNPVPIIPSDRERPIERRPIPYLYTFKASLK